MPVKNQKHNRKILRNQIEEDKMAEKTTMKEYVDPFTGESVKGSK
jgi:putative transposase